MSKLRSRETARVAPATLAALRRFLRRFDAPARVPEDPVHLVRAYDDPRDREVAGLLAASVAYGRVSLFKPRLERLLAKLGLHPARFAREAAPAEVIRACAGFSYRMTRATDMACLIHAIGCALRAHGSLEAAFGTGAGPARGSTDGDDEDVIRGLAALVRILRTADLSPVLGPARVAPRGFRFLLAEPEKGSACKRLLLFLRWMVRPAGPVDMGVWRTVSPARLVVPLDTHVDRIARLLGLVRRRARDLRTAREATRAFSAAVPDDPLALDFALCHLGASGRCPVRPSAACCRECDLRSACRVGKRLAPEAAVNRR